MFLRLYPYFFLIFALVPLTGLGVYVIFNHVIVSVFHIIYVKLLVRTRESNKDFIPDIEEGH
jgi:hypothetical protein